jgi:hypothetical protein
VVFAFAFPSPPCAGWSIPKKALTWGFFVKPTEWDAMTILVTGANGGVGRLVVEGLVREGEKVRALTRTPDRASFPDGVEVAGGDLTEPESLLDALRGAERLYLFRSRRPRGGWSSWPWTRG